MEKLAGILVAVFSFWVTLFILFIYVRRAFFKRKTVKENRIRSQFITALQSIDAEKMTDELITKAFDQRTVLRYKDIFMEAVSEFSDICSLKPKGKGYPFYNYLNKIGFTDYLNKLLRSKQSWRLTMAINFLIKLNLRGFSKRVTGLLIHPDDLVRFSAIEYLLRDGSLDYLPEMLDQLALADNWYLEHYMRYLVNNQAKAEKLLLQISTESSCSIARQLCAAKILKRFNSTEVEAFFKHGIKEMPSEVREVAAEYLFEKDPSFLIEHGYDRDSRPYIRSLAIRAMEKTSYQPEYIEILLEHSNEQFPVILNSVMTVLISLIKRKPDDCRRLEDLLINGNSFDKIIIKVFKATGRLKTYIRELHLSKESDRARRILTKAIWQSEVTDILVYLAEHPNSPVCGELTELMIKHCSPQVLKNNIDLLERVACTMRQPLDSLLVDQTDIPSSPAKKSNFRLRLMLAGILTTSLLIPFLMHLYWYRGLVQNREYNLYLMNLILDFNRAIVFYVASINTSYLILGVLSLMGLIWYKQRKKAWTLGDYFRRKMVPPVSIIAPCYNEAATVVESVNSLVNMRYPKFEVIVVNDGSRDETLSKLIDYFRLEEAVVVYSEMIHTAKIRNIYISKDYPKLLVLDKENGGKADALNAGINIAHNPYFCAIDADTLLDGDALMHATAPFAFDHLSTVATGCNIRVINGCRVDHGVIEKRALPKGMIERFQVMEYVRSFIAGRIGWSYINSMLIISGAFGVFNKELALTIGGYSSREGRGQDTVGEDMELAVAYHKEMAKQKRPYQVLFCHDASGWTEVPFKLRSLKRQRNRWQRGLIEVLLGNLKMFFNYRLGNAGLLAFPYFFLFEFLGPWIEAAGYVFIVLAWLLGIINPVVLTMLFAFSVLYGVMVSMLSLYLEEKDGLRYSNREMLTLTFYAVFENFGYRQLLAFWRVGAYFSFLWNRQGWGVQERKGFSGNTGSTSALPGIGS